jgi:hypothetical protein
MHAPRKQSTNTTVDGGYEYEEMDSIYGNPVDRNTGWKLLVAPFHKKETSYIHAAISVATVYVMSLFVGWWFLGIVNWFVNLTITPTVSDLSIRLLTFGFVGAAVYWMASYVSCDDDFPITPYPEITVAMFGTMHKLGLVMTLIYLTAQFGGFLTAGAILRNTDTTYGNVRSMSTALSGGLYNISTDPTGRWLIWLGSTVICLVYIFAVKFRNTDETEKQAQSRGVIASTLAIFVLTISFVANGNKYYSSGFSVAAFIATGENVDAAFRVLVPWAGAATAVALVLAAMAFLRWGTGRTMTGSGKKSDDSASMSANARVSSSMRVGAKLRNVEATY